MSDGMKKIGSGEVGGTPVGFYTGKYAVKPYNLAVVAMCEDDCPEPFGDISTNLGNPLDPSEFVFNHNMLPHKDELMATGFFEDTGRRVDYGFIRDCPVWRLK